MTITRTEDISFLPCSGEDFLTLMTTCCPGFEEIASEEIRQKLNGLGNGVSIFIYHIYSKFEQHEENILQDNNKEIIRIFNRRDIKSMLQGKIIIQFHFSSTTEELKTIAISLLLECFSIVKIHVLVYILENLNFPCLESITEKSSNEPTTGECFEEKEREWVRKLKNDPNFNYFLKCHQKVMPESKCWKESLEKWIDMRNILFENSSREKFTSIESLKFRITSKRSGQHNFKSSDILSWYGLLVSHELMGEEICNIGKTWKADLTNYDLDIFSNLYNDTLFLSFTVCEETICLHTFSKQFNTKLSLNSTSLRPNIAYGLINVSNIKKGDVFCDICSGSGIISLMAFHLFKNSIQIISGELSDEILQSYLIKNIENYKFSISSNPYIQPVRWDFTRLPLKTASIDVICSNLPFGKQIGSHSLNKEIYPPMFSELCRILKPGSGRVILLTSEKHLISKALAENKVFISLQQRISIHQGGSDVFVFIITRKTKEWFNRSKVINQNKLINKI